MAQSRAAVAQKDTDNRSIQLKTCGEYFKKGMYVSYSV